MRYSLTLLLLWLTLASCAVADSVEIANGNIEYLDHSGVRLQLTRKGIDSDAVLSPDGNTIAFVRSTPISGKVEEGEPLVTTELRTISKSGQQESVILQERVSNDPKTNLQLLHSPRFSPDGNSIYIMSMAWATSSAIHKVDLATRQPVFITDGNSLDIVPVGTDKGKLIVQKHKYFAAGGTYDFYWLLTPDGKELNPVGDTEEQVKSFLEGA